MYIDINLQKRYEILKRVYRNGEYTDRTELIEYLNSLIDTPDRYVCVNSLYPTGKSVMADMLASYYSNSVQSRVHFEQMNIKEKATYLDHLNKHHVIYMSMKCSKLFWGNYIDYICRVEEKIIKKLQKKFVNVNINLNNSVWYNLNEIYVKTGHRFIFIVDDWDYVFNVSKFTKENCIDYVKMLIEVFSGCEYAELVYFTGKHSVSHFVKSKKMPEFSEFELIDFKGYKNRDVVTAQ